MSRVYSQADYQGVVDDNYRRYLDIDLRGDLLHSRFNALLNDKILVAGCGWGYLVDKLITLGFTDVWGCDASSFGVLRGRTEMPTRAARILEGDCLSASSMDAVRLAAGLTGNRRFRLVITDDMLPCMASLAEVQTCLSLLRSIAQTVIHVISCWEPDAWGIGNTFRDMDGSIRLLNGERVVNMPGFLWWTAEEWRTAIGSGELIVRTGGYELVP